MEKPVYKNENSRGSILIFSVIILGTLLSVMFGILGIFIPKLKIAADPIKSTIAAFTADSAVEWCLYVKRGNPSPPLKPVLGDNPVGSGFYPTYVIYSPASGINVSNCDEADLDHRIVGSYSGIARSFELSQPVGSTPAPTPTPTPAPTPTPIPTPTPTPAPSLIAFVKHNGATLTAAPFQIAYTGGVAAGHLLTAVITLNSNTITITGVTDSLGSSWQRAKRQAHTTDTTTTEIWYAMNSTAGATNTVSIAFSATPANVQVGVHEWSGVATAGALDQTNGLDNIDTISHRAGGIVSPAANSLVIFGLRTTNAFNIASTPPGYSNLEPQNPRGRAYYKIKTDSAAEDPVLTFADLEISAAAIATFRPQ